MADYQFVSGGVPVPSSVLVSADQETIAGDGSATNPLHAVPGTVGSQFVFVYRPGGIADAPNVFTDWASLMAAKSLVQGVKYLQIDSTIQIAGGSLSFSSGVVTYVTSVAIPLTTTPGQELTISDAASPGNNGTFIVSTVTFISSSAGSEWHVTFANASGSNELSFEGVFSILGGFTCVIPAAGMPSDGWDMTDTELCGFHSPVAVGGAGGQLVSFGGAPSGGDVQFKNWRKAGSEIALKNLNVTLPANVIPVGGAIFEWGTGYTGDFPQLFNDGSAPMWDASALQSGQSFTLRLNGVIGVTSAGSGSPAIALGASPGAINLTLTGATRFTANMISGSSTSATINASYIGSATQFTRQTNFAGQYAPTVDFSRISMVPVALLGAAPIPSTVALTLVVNSLNSYNTTAGNIAQTLPAIKNASPPIGTGAGALNTTGMPIMIKNLVGGNAVNVSPAASNTIDGGAGPVAVAAGKVGYFISDGVSNWIQILP